MNFIEAMKISEGVLSKYKIDQLKWWKRLDGTPMLNDLAVRFSLAFMEAATEKQDSAKRCKVGSVCTPEACNCARISDESNASTDATNQPVQAEHHVFIQPGWNHVSDAFINGAKEQAENPTAVMADWVRAADGYTKRVHEQVDPETERRIRENDWPEVQPVQATPNIHDGAKLLTDSELSDPEYMRAYISGMHETIEDLKAAQSVPVQAKALTDDGVEAIAVEAFTHAVNGGHRHELYKLPKRSQLRALLVSQPSAQADVAAVRDVIAERKRQRKEEGWTPALDDRHKDCQLAAAAATYAVCNNPDDLKICGVTAWPWSRVWWKPTTYRRNLVKAGALIIAEIERIDRAAPTGQPQADGVKQ